MFKNNKPMNLGMFLKSPFRKVGIVFSLLIALSVLNYSSLSGFIAYVKAAVPCILTTYANNHLSIPMQCGSNFTGVTSSVTQPACYSSSYPTPTFYWVFSSAVSPYNNGTNVPSQDYTPALAASTQNSVNIQVSANSSFSPILCDSGDIATTANNYAFGCSSMAFNSNYYWRIAVKDSYGTWSNWSAASAVFTSGIECIPNAPSNVTVSETNNSCKTVSVSWTDNSTSPQESGFSVEHSTDGTLWNSFCNVAAGVTNCSKTLASSTAYYIRARANGAYGNSAWVNASAYPYSTKYCPPDRLSITSQTGKQIGLGWRQQGNGVSRYDVFRRESGSGVWGASIGTVSFVSGNYYYSFNDTSFSPGKIYEYKVTAYTDPVVDSAEIVTSSSTLTRPKWKEIVPR